MTNFKQYLNLYWRSTWKIQLLIVLLMYFLLAVNYCIGYIDDIVSYHTVHVVPEDNTVNVMVNNIGLGLCAFIACASAMFGTMSSKEGRLANLCLPVGVRAKYATYFLTSIVFPIVAFYVCAFLADWTRMAIVSVAAGPELAVATPVSYMLTFSGADDWHIAVVVLILLLMAQAFFAAGSIFFPGKSFLKTLGLSAGLCVAAGFMVYFSIQIFFPDEISIKTIDFDVYFWSLVLAALVVTVALHVVSYYRLKESEVQNRW